MDMVFKLISRLGRYGFSWEMLVFIAVAVIVVAVRYRKNQSQQKQTEVQSGATNEQKHPADD